MDVKGCFGREHNECYGCFYCINEPECLEATLKNRKDDTMYMEITITKPATEPETEKLTMEELVNKKILLEAHKANAAARILGYVKKGEYDQMHFRNAEHYYREACEELEKVEQKIQFMDEENKLLTEYWDLLNDHRDAHYKLMVAKLEGEKKVVDNAYKDISRIEDVIWETERKLRDLRDRKFAQK